MAEMFVRNCPKCGKELFYKVKKDRNRAERKCKACRNCTWKEVNNRLELRALWAAKKKISLKGSGNPFYRHKHSSESIKKMITNADRSVCKTKEFREKMSAVTSGSLNPMYGRRVYDIWCEKYGEEIAVQKLNAQRAKTSAKTSGSKNPMYGKPSPKGSGNGWSGWYKGWYFRSLRELSYMLLVIEANNLTWENAEKKQYSIPYIDNGKKRTYRADFLIGGKLLIEVKPERMMNIPTNKLKKEAAEKFCQDRGWEYKIVDSVLLTNEKLKKLCADGLVRLIPKWHERLNQCKNLKLISLTSLSSVKTEACMKSRLHRDGNH